MDNQPPVSNNPAPLPVNPAPPNAPTPPPPPAPAAAPVPSLPATLTTWPGAFGVYKYSKQAVMLNIGAVIIIWLADGFIGFGAEIISKRVGEIISLLVGSLASAALALVFIGSVRGQRVEVDQALKAALGFWLKMIGLTLLVGIIAIISLLLLVIPFFIVLPRIVLSTYYLIDRKMGVVEALKASWAATKGHSSKVWGIIGASFAMLALAVTIIGIPFAIYFIFMYSAAFVVLYEFLNKTQATATAVASAPPPPVEQPPQAPVQPAI